MTCIEFEAFVGSQGLLAKTFIVLIELKIINALKTQWGLYYGGNDAVYLYICNPMSVTDRRWIGWFIGANVKFSRTTSSVQYCK